MMNKEYMMQQGGVSKATKMLNLSEDVLEVVDLVHCSYGHLSVITGNKWD